MALKDCREYHEGIIEINQARIERYEQSKNLSQIIGFTIFFLALLSFTRFVTIDLDHWSKLSGIACGLFFYSKDLISKPDIDGLKKEILSKKLILKKYDTYKSLSNEEKISLENSCSKLLENLNTSK